MATVNGTGSNLSVFLRGPSGFAAEAGSPFADGPRTRVRRRGRLQRRRPPGRRHAELQRRHGQRPAPPAGRRLRRRADAERRRGHRLGHRRGLQRRRAASTSLHRATTNSNSPHLPATTAPASRRRGPPTPPAPRPRDIVGRRLQRRRSAGPGHLQPRRAARSPSSCATPGTTASPRRPRRSRSAPRPRASRRRTSTATVWPDIAVAVLGTNTVNVLLRNPGGGFTAEAPIPVGAGALGLATADFNADGRPDLAVTSNTAGTGHGAAAPGGRRLRGRRCAAAGAGRQRRRRGRLQRGRQAGPRGLQRHRPTRSPCSSTRPRRRRLGPSPSPRAPASARPGQVGRWCASSRARCSSSTRPARRRPAAARRSSPRSPAR